MRRIRLVAALAVALGLSACATPDLATRQQTFLEDGSVSVAASGPGAPVAAHRVVAAYHVRDIRVTVPETLKVSEANLYFPIADIVWHGEPRGNRHEQVAAMFDEGFRKGTAGMKTGPGVIVEAEVLRFHSLTPKTRYTVGGVHAIRYRLTLRDAATGAIVEGPREVQADVRGAGGRRALDEESRGLTMRVVIVENLALSIMSELSRRVPVSQDEAVVRLDDDLRLTLTAVSMMNERAAPVALASAR